MPPYFSCDVIQVSGSRDIHIRLETACLPSADSPFKWCWLYIILHHWPSTQSGQIHCDCGLSNPPPPSIISVRNSQWRSRRRHPCLESRSEGRSITKKTRRRVIERCRAMIKFTRGAEQNIVPQSKATRLCRCSTKEFLLKKLVMICKSPVEDYESLNSA